MLPGPSHFSPEKMVSRPQLSGEGEIEEVTPLTAAIGALATDSQEVGAFILRKARAGG